MRFHVAAVRSGSAPVFRWTAVACALTVWLLGLFAVQPQWHEALHHDAGQQDHSCAITLFSHGLETGAGVPATVGAPLLSLAGLCLLAPAMPATDAHLRLPPACGPPAC